MKIAIVLDRFEPHRGGLEEYAFELSAWLAKAGHDVHVLAFAIGAEAGGFPVTSHHLEPAPSRRERAEVAERALEELGADVVHDFGTGWAFDVLHPLFGSRVAARRGDLASANPLRRLRLLATPSRWRAYREMRGMEDRQYGPGRGIVIAASKRVETHLRQLHGVEPSRIRLIYNGVDTQTFSPEHRAEHRDATRRKLGVGDETLFVFSAHNFRLKGLWTAVEAACLLADRGVPFHLAVMGDGWSEPYARLAASRGAERRVTFCGLVEDPVPYYAAADACVHPTYYDPCSLVVLEAWASGLPAVTTPLNGASELMTHGREGFVLDDPRNARALADQMEKLTDGSLRRGMGEAARELAVRHSIELKFREIETLYRDLRVAREA